jgi:hypothetical protein
MLSLVVALSLQSKTVDYAISMNDKPVGEAKVLIKITQDGGKRTDSKLTLKIDGKTLDMHSTQVWAFSGRPTLKIVQTFDAKGVEVKRTRIDFAATSATITQLNGAKLSKKTVPIDPKAEIRDLFEFWFLRDEPLKGKPYEYQVFNATSLKWERAKSTYIGETEKDINGTKMMLRQISQDIGAKHLDVWLDSEGFPVLSATSDGTKIVLKQ